MLVAQDLADEIIAAMMEGVSSPEDANTKISTVLNEYTVENAEIMFAWSGVSPDGSPDPVTVATGEVTLMEVVLFPSGAEDPLSAIASFVAQIVGGMNLAMFNITAPGWNTVPGQFSSASNVGDLDISIDADNLADAMLQFSEDWVSYFTALTPSAPCTGTHGPYTGSGAITSIS